jgi:hypothetical protein
MGTHSKIGRLQIKLAHEQAAAVGDCLQRATVGVPYGGTTPQQAWLAGRGVWKLNARRAHRQRELQIVDPDGVVVAVGSIKGVQRCGDRYAIDGDLWAHDPRIGRPTTTPHRSRNPVGYF